MSETFEVTGLIGEKITIRADRVSMIHEHGDGAMIRVENWDIRCMEPYKAVVDLWRRAIQFPFGRMSEAKREPAP